MNECATKCVVNVFKPPCTNVLYPAPVAAYIIKIK